MNTGDKGFSGQWVDIFTTGRHVDDAGNTHDIDAAFLEAVAANLNLELHEPPAVIGHPKTDAPAYGWACGLRVEGNTLQAQFCGVDPGFAELVRKGLFKKRSSSFYVDADVAPGGRVPALRHVGFLGAKPPSVKGLRNIKFNEGEAVTFEDVNFSEGESMDEKEIKKTIGEAIVDFFKPLFGKGGKESSAAFSEAEFNERVTSAVEAATASITTKLTALEEKNKSLEDQLKQHSGATTKSEIVAFCEALGKEKFPPAFKSMGAVEFMEALAALPDRKVKVVTFSEKDGQQTKVETESTLLKWFMDFLEGIGPVVQFGEQFGALSTADATSADLVDPARRQKLREDMGLPAKEAK